MLPQDVDALLRAPCARQIALFKQKDCYALNLLRHVIGGGRRVAELRRGPFARMLERATVKSALARASHGVLTPGCLHDVLPAPREHFSISLARGGGRRSWELSDSYYQTSRPGQSLVVQLNFPTLHDRAYRRLVAPEAASPFVSSAHPARAEEPFTLAWARLDADPRSPEVLIEEVQSDWVKRARRVAERACEWLAAGNPSHHRFDSELDTTAPELLSYVNRVLSPYARVWEDAVLMAAIEFAYAELGARRVYFHTFEGGRIMKQLGGWLPPRSLYTDLPERFGFTKTRVPPRAFRKDPRVEKERVEWYELSLV